VVRLDSCYQSAHDHQYQQLARCRKAIRHSTTQW
jgi:hypothetical protein